MRLFKQQSRRYMHKPLLSCCAVLIIISTRVSAGYCQQSYFSVDPVWIAGLPGNTNSIAVGDVDGDGDLDLMCGGYNALYLNRNGEFSTTPDWVLTAERFTHDVALGDVDGDGDLDLVCGNYDDNNTLYLNEGIIFANTPAWMSVPARRTREVALGDVDGDNDLDLICANGAQRNTLYLNEGGVFSTSPVWESDSAFASTGLALGDIDGDGDLDLAFANFSGQRNTLYVNAGGMYSTSPIWYTDLANYTWHVAFGDIDGDGDLDLICGNYFNSSTLYLNEGGMLSTTSSWFSDPANRFTYGLDLGDVDGDGDLDLVCGSRGLTDCNTLYLNEGGMLTTSPVWLSRAEGNTWDVALGDVDGDGDLDLFCGNQLRGNTLYENLSGVFSMAPVWSSVPENDKSDVALGDVDGDGDLDFVCGIESRVVGNELYLNTAGVLDTIPVWISDPTSYTKSIALGDVDCDGDLDLVCGNVGENTLYFNNGGSFSTSPIWESDSAFATNGVALGDVDGDGDLDLVCGNSDRNTLYLNDGIVFQTAPVWFSEPDRLTESVALGDVDGDGDLDLVCGNNRSDALYLNEGAIFSTTPVWESDLSYGNVTYSVALGDVDGDGDPDLVCGDRFGSNSLYINDGGMFSKTPAWSSGEYNSTESVALGDVDGDGDLDLVCGNAAVDKNTLYLNEGGVFSSAPDWSSSNADWTKGVALGDINGDGDLDLVCGNGNSGNNTLYAGMRAPVFKGNPLAPTNHLPNNSVDLRGVTVTQLSANLHHVQFTVSDVESDPVWIVPEYQFKGDPTWYLAEVGGQLGKVGPFSTSPAGTAGSFDWNISRMPFDTRDVSLRLTTVEAPNRVSLIQQSTSFVTEIGRIPSIAAHARPSSGIEFLQGRDIVVDLSLPPGATPDQARLFFRRGGERTYQEIRFADGDPLPTATIPLEWIGARGIEYWAKLQTATGSITDPRNQPSEHPRTIRVTATNMQENQSYPGEVYRLLSIPMELEGSLSIIRALEDDIGFPDPMRWRMFLYDRVGSEYIEVPNDSLSSFEHGRGYWLVTRESHRLDTGPVFGRSTPTDGAFASPLEPGWNLIGQPFVFDVAWDSIRVEGQTIAGVTMVEPPVGWTGDRYAYDTAVLEPWKGYWVKNLADSVVTLEIPPREVLGSAAMAKSAKKNLSNDEWTIAIKASSQGAVDADNYVGVRIGASTVWDKHDRSEAPLSPVKSISLYFPHVDWERNPGYYAFDIRGEYEVLELGGLSADLPEEDLWGHIWSFDIAKSFFNQDAGDEISLEFAEIERVPEEAEIYLVDQRLGRTINLRKGIGYDFFQGNRDIISDETEARFILLVGSVDFIASHEDRFPQLPTETVLHQNHPNPFNPSTIIRYELTKAGSVKLKIYDVSGALVKVLEDLDRNPGRYEVGWDGMNERDEKVASGVYFYVLEAPETRIAKKMLCVK